MLQGAHTAPPPAAPGMPDATRWHKLLERQLRRHYGSLDAVPSHLHEFLDTVSTTYEQADSDRRLVEHSLDLASQELLQRNAELRAKQLEQQVIFDSVPALIIYKDTENRILRLNETAAKALGGTTAQLEGKRTEDVLPPDVAHRLYEDDLEVIRSGRPKLAIIESHSGPEGRMVWMRTDKVPFRDEAGRVVGVIVFSVDITERKQTESKLHESEARYRLIVETATEGIWTLDGQGRTTFVNGIMAQMLGYSREEMQGRNVFDFIPPEERATGQERLASILQGTHVALDFRFRRKDGSDLWTQASGAPMLDDQGGVVGALGMLTDITKRKAAEADLAAAYRRLQEVDKERMQFLNNAAHELSTPLTPIKLQLRLLGMQARGTPSERQTQVLDRNFERLAHLVKDLLDAARLQAASLRLNLQPIDLRDIVYQTAETYLPAAHQAGLDLVIDDELPSVPVHADMGRMSQVLDNLVSNAIKFTPRGGTVRLDLQSHDGWARVAVRDSGRGIRKEDLGALFQPFKQVHDTMQETFGGTGLGLYVSRGLVEAHGGHIHGDSDGPGKGATFWFELPLKSRSTTRQP